MSANGPSGRGVNSASQSPHSTRARRPHLIAEAAKDERLPDPRLAGDKHDAASTITRVGKGLVQALQHRLALQQIAAARCRRYHHRRIVAADEAPIKWRPPSWVAGAPNLGGTADATAAPRPYRRQP